MSSEGTESGDDAVDPPLEPTGKPLEGSAEIREPGAPGLGAELRGKEYTELVENAIHPSELPRDFVNKKMEWVGGVEQKERDVEALAAAKEGRDQGPTHHAMERHLLVTEDEHARDPNCGITHDGLVVRLDKGEGRKAATAFTSRETFAMAEAKAWQYPQRQEKLDKAIERDQDRFSMDISIAEALGPDWRQHVAGVRWAEDGPVPLEFTDNSVIFVQYKRTSDGEWAPYTMYPRVPA